MMKRTYLIKRRSDELLLATELSINAAFASAERLVGQFGPIVIRDALGGRIAEVSVKPSKE